MAAWPQVMFVVILRPWKRGFSSNAARIFDIPVRIPAARSMNRCPVAGKPGLPHLIPAIHSIHSFPWRDRSLTMRSDSGPGGMALVSPYLAKPLRTVDEVVREQESA